MFDRRSAILGAGALLGAGCARGRPAVIYNSGIEALRRIEERARGRLGAFILDPTNGESCGWREHERFAHCSSFKLSLAAMLLAKADAATIDPGEVLRWTDADLLPHSPVTSKNGKRGMSVRDLAHAALVTSDNTAANTLLRRFGGPQELTRFWRLLGDTTSRIDRYEPELNETPPGTELDTTTPAAMARTVAEMLLGEHLSPRSRSTLSAWMREVTSGRERIRAGLPASWVSGDKTGTGIGAQRHTYVDLAFGGPPGATPLIIAAYFEPERLVEPMDPVSLAALADVGRIAASRFASQRKQRPIAAKVTLL